MADEYKLGYPGSALEGMPVYGPPKEETVLRDCGQRGACRTPPGCARHWEERNRELSSQVESMAMRIESLAEELAKPEDVRLREVLEALEGRAVIFDGLGARVRHLLNEMDEWIGRAGEAERLAEVRLHGGQWRPTATDAAFAPPFGTIRQCRVCGCLVAGGPTACARCAEEGD